MNSNNQENWNNEERPERYRPNEIPEKRESEQEKSGYPHEIEQEQQQDGSNASYSEQVDVTPPSTPEFPKVGIAETDFRPSNHGRTTGRMISHEPGTENNL